MLWVFFQEDWREPHFENKKGQNPLCSTIASRISRLPKDHILRRIHPHTEWYYFSSSAFKIWFDFKYSFSTQLILLKHGARQMIGSPQMFEDNLNEPVIGMNEQYGTVPSFWNLKWDIHRLFFFFFSSSGPPTKGNKLLIWLLEKCFHPKEIEDNMKHCSTVIRTPRIQIQAHGVI